MNPGDALEAELERPPVCLPVDRGSELLQLGLCAFWVFLMLYQALAHSKPLEPGWRAFFWIGAAGFTINGAGYLWRVLDPRPVIEAAEAGLVCHPSYYPGTLPWSEIQEVEATGLRSGTLRIRVRRRFWSLTRWLGGTHILLNLRDQELTREQREAMADDLNAWRAASSEGPGDAARGHDPISDAAPGSS